MLSVTPNGLYCKEGDFYIDPYHPVDTAIITHGHADHARWGMNHYIATPITCDIMKIRLGKEIHTIPQPYHSPFKLGNATLQFLPAGHILGSAQVLIECNNQRAIITGDFKIDPDPTVDSFETTSADILVMETTFGLPIYHWPDPKTIFNDIHLFWKRNQSEKKATVLYAYSLGKAQRLIAGLDPSQGPIAVHSAIDKMNQIYKNDNKLLNTPPVVSKAIIDSWDRPGIVITPPATIDSKWLKQLGAYREAYVSGWMMSKGQIRRRNMRGFVLSDHADWPGLLETVRTVSPQQVWTMHGYTDIFARYLNEIGVSASPLGALQMERTE